MNIVFFRYRWLPGSFAKKAALNTLLSAVIVFCLLPLAACTATIPHCCLVLQCTGLPCPGCGITRAVVGCLHGDWAGAWAANPAILPLAVGYTWLLGAATIQLLSRHAPLARAAQIANSISLGALLIVWGLRMT